MKTLCVVGAQWGDEGKGKIVDLLAADADYVVRFQGGNNAAHTLMVNGRKEVLRLVPAGVLHPGKVCVIGNGAVVDPIALVDELRGLRRRWKLPRRGSLKLSHNAHLVMPYHRAIDRAREARLGKRAIGTTGFGIGPAYEDKAARTGLRFADLADFDSFTEKLRRNFREKNRYLTQVLGARPISAASTLAAMRAARRYVIPLMCDTSVLLGEAIASGKRVLFEGAHGTMLDIDHGTYPFVTSSNCIASAACSGAGVAPTSLDATLGISKAYTTRVGAGPFPSEIEGELAGAMRSRAKEFGSATGRPRRIGWFDAVLARHSARVNGFWGLAITKLDVMTGIDPLRICVGYRIGTKRFEVIPPTSAMIARVRPIYEEMPGWSEDVSAARRVGDLPLNARRYLSRLEEIGGVKIVIVSVGSERDATIVVQNPFAA